MAVKSDQQNVVCISTIDWDFVWQGHQEIMSTLARQGHRVLFIENTGVRSVAFKDLPRLKHRLMNWRRGTKGIRKVMDHLYVYAPLVLPFPYSKVARAINKTLMFWTLRRWVKSMRFDSPIIWTWLPTALALELIQVLDGQLVVYYCCDDFQASSSGSRRIRETEDVLLREADLVFAHSKALYDRCSQLNSQVQVFQYGFNEEVFAHADGCLPTDLECVKRPIIGYVGGVHQHVDLELLEKVAIHHRDKSLVLVGPLQVGVERFARLSNVHFLGQKSYKDLPNYIKCFDVGLIPYKLNEYTRSVYPTKLNEYLTMGKPVVSTRLPEIEYFNESHQGVVAVADSHESFVKRIAEEIGKDNEVYRTERIRQVAKNTWGKKIEAMQGLIQAKLEEKAKMREINWQQTLARFYWYSRHRAAGVVVASLLVYGLVFYTPLVWTLAEPLRVVDQPVQADVIIVLAGGVGESGEPGEAYQEKVQYGVELYKQAYASKLIFSSGVGYVFKEAQVMKALAVSLGVPEGAIILDEHGGGNYANLLSAREIMKAHGWTRMLLVTSRYNAIRSRLVARKNLTGITVTLTSAPHSAFFGERQQVAAKHVRAIAHEYAGILYYWWKGYI